MSGSQTHKGLPQEEDTVPGITVYCCMNFWIDPTLDMHIRVRLYVLDYARMLLDRFN